MITSLIAGRRFSTIAISAKFSILFIVKPFLDLLDVSTGDLIRPCEMFRINQHPGEPEQKRKSGDQVSGSAPASPPRIKRYLFRPDYDEPQIFHARSLARAQHEQEEIDRYESEVTRAINPENAPVRSEVFRHFKRGRDEKNNINHGDDREIGQPCGDTWH